MSRRHLYLPVLLLLLCWFSLAHADQSKGSRADSGSRSADTNARGDQDRRQQDSSQVRRDVLREAVKSQEDDAPVLLRQLSAEEKALLRQQLRQQRLEGSR